jgi:starvation-inducible DNA-binding protein
MHYIPQEAIFMKLNIDIKDSDRQHLVTVLSGLLADTYLLYLKTQNFHWNVTGPHFHDLHLMFEDQYKLLADAVDEIAERIRALGGETPATFTQFLKLTSLQEPKIAQIKAQEMIRELLADHEKIIREAREWFDIAETASDDASADLFAERLREHEKLAWMLRSTLE